VTRRYFDENGFLEIETPILYKSTPEGAREFLVPSGTRPGNCYYALPAEPAALQADPDGAGCDRYMQICRCFRDEDPRADRQAEFTQIDLEMSFVRREQVMEMMEGFVRRLWKEMAGVRCAADPADDLSRGDGATSASTGPTRATASRSRTSRTSPPRPRSRSSRRRSRRAPTARVQQQEGRGQGDPRARRRRRSSRRKMTDGYTEFVKGFGAGGVAVVKLSTRAPSGRLRDRHRQVPRAVKAELKAALKLGASGDTVLFVADTYSVAPRRWASCARRWPATWAWCPSPARGRAVELPVGRRLPDVREEQGHGQVGRDAPPLHQRRATTRREAFVNADVDDEVDHRGDRLGGVRHRAQRPGDRGRQRPHPRPARCRARSSRCWG
jgi:hypothetical protein